MKTPRSTSVPERGINRGGRTRRILLLSAAGMIIGSLAASSLLLRSLNSSAESPRIEDAERARLVAAGQTLLWPVEEWWQAPPIRLRTAAFGDGSDFDLAQERGKIVVLYFMAAWCLTCVPEAEALAQLHANYSNRGVRILVLDVDPNDAEERLERFRQLAGSGGHLWAQDTGFQVARPYRVRSLDTTVVIDRQGRIVYADWYPTAYDDLAAIVETVSR